ncbi:alginate lyase family protein [uncultured Polaribacter sp.]|uniref:alginate lyase family protein n=1 Tax=uncultured Polaribacter sp. TaxID=174711 RepID=UPI0026070E3A|nr:alginate lyase family protein [uncultured Polaribacter sp.]
MTVKKQFYTFLICTLLTLVSCQEKKEIKAVKTGSHPNLILTTKSVSEIKANLGNTPILDKTLKKTIAEVDAALEKGIDVPMPEDMAGGYTHTQHKLNYANMQKAGVLFQLLDDEKYAIFVRDMLLEYAKIFPTFNTHPEPRSYATGKFFWQCLNDSNWLTYTSQAYDCIYSWLPKEQTDYLNKNLFRPYADFLSVENPKYFNRVHNHSTWGNVAVGMIGLVMGDDELINRALYGLDKSNVDLTEKDNDGGFIYDKDGKAGFLANVDSPFSPDGFYTEGPYYQRYAMYPFLIFAAALQNKKPALKIFEYKNGVLIKAVDALLNLTDADGEFFPLNDGQKGMSYFTPSLVSAVNIAYYYGKQDARLLSVAKKQGSVQLDATGLKVAIALKNGEEKPFIKQSMQLSDGSKGDEGGIGILRYNHKDETMALVYKYAAQGLSHGHYDKLSFSMYENGEEVLQDYGLSRFVNVAQKNGGGYLKENKTYAKHTIAHNTITQNETSHFNYDFEAGSKNHPEKYVFNVADENFQMVSAKEKNAYPGTEMHRTFIMIKDESLAKPFIVDICKVASEQKNQYDLPFHYFGQIISTSFKYEVPKTLSILGQKHGYNHIWKEGSGTANAESIQFTWLDNRKFYSLTAATNKNDEIILARIGANDPEFNLRKDPSIIIRKKNTQNTVYASIIESHGTYNPVKEVAHNAYSNFKNIKVLSDDANYTAVKLQFKNGKEKTIILANLEHSKDKKHTINIHNKNYNWVGAYYYK